MGNDSSLTLQGCRDLLQSPISVSQMYREMKAANLTRKRLKKRSIVRVTDENRNARQTFCANVLGMNRRRILFLDESGFNLHTSTNYGYSSVSEEAILYQPRSQGRNVSLCSIISTNRIEHFKLVDGAYNREIFLTFLNECYEREVFVEKPVLVLDNVRYHHCAEIADFFIQKNIEILFLPAYSPDLNPIENVFSTIKSSLDRIRPRENS